MTPTPQDCSQCGTTIVNEHGIKTKFMRVNPNNTCEAKCKKCGTFNLVPLTYTPIKPA